MTQHRIRAALTPLAFAATMLMAAGACSGGSEPPPPSEPTFLMLSDTAPDLARTTFSFWARTDEERDGEIEFVAAPGALDTVSFVEFKVPAGSLLERPNGAAFGAVDSILITITVVDAQRLIFDFQPSGLRFSPTVPALLEIYYGYADDDYDADGDRDADDDLIESTRLAIWKRESLGSPWVRLGSIREIELNEVEANITSFTGYAIAF